MIEPLKAEFEDAGKDPGNVEIAGWNPGPTIEGWTVFSARRHHLRRSQREMERASPREHPLLGRPSGEWLPRSALRRLQCAAIDNDRLAGAEAGLHQL
jgi:hypothetical protein